VGRLLPLLLVLVALPGTAIAGSITARLDRSSLAVGESTRLTIEVQGDAEGAPKLAEVEGLGVEVVGTSMNTRLSRGRTSTVTSYACRLTARKEGTWILGPARATIDGQSKASESFEVKVTPARAPQTAASSQQDRTSRGGPATAPPGQPGGDYYAIATVSDATPWVGQSITYDVEVGSALRTSGQTSWEQPSLGSLALEPGTEMHQDDRRQMIEGRAYNVTTIRLPIFPVEVGQTEVGAARFGMTVLRQRRNWAGINVTVREPVAFEAAAVPVHARALPTRGRPAGFQGIVGRFSVEASLNTDRVETGKTATLTVRVTGSGSLRGKRLTPELPPSFEIYDEAPEASFRVGASGLRTEVVARYHLLSREPGTFEIPGVALPHFDPERQRYVVARSQPVRLEVTGAPISEEAVVSRSAGLVHAKEEVEVLGTDILPLHTGPRMYGDARVGFGSPLILGLLLLPLLGFCGLAVRASRERMAGTAGGQRRQRQRAAKRARADSRRAATAGDVDAAEAALREYLTARLQRSGAALSPDDGPRVLAEEGAPEELADDLGSLLARLEAARFGGGETRGLAEDIDAWLGDAETLW